LNGKIGTVNSNNNSLITKIGEYNGSSIFVDHTLASGRVNLVEGFYQNENTFYDKVVGYTQKIEGPYDKYMTYYDIDDKLLYIIGLYENEKPEMQEVEKLKDLIKENKPFVNFDEMSTKDFIIHMKGLFITIYEHKSEIKIVKEKAVDKCTSNCLLF
jgi:hypothetical protein